LRRRISKNNGVAANESGETKIENRRGLIPLNQKITPSIKQFERKLEGLNVFTAQEFIKNMANPLYYSPMLTTLFTNVPAIASMGFSLGVISLQSFLQRRSKKLEIQDDPLYFTVKMRNQL
jgi:hypothetical protein